MKRMTLRTKLLSVFLGATIAAVVAISLTSVFVSNGIITRMISNEVTNMSQTLSASARIAYQISMDRITEDLHQALALVGPEISLDNARFISVQAVNQTTGAAGEIRIPQLLRKGAPVYENNSLPDEIKKATDDSATFFQMIPGGMLRLATTIQKENGARATGTFIPAESPVYRAVAAGKEFIGRAKVLNTWNLAGYSPLKDKDGQVIGAIFVGIPEERLHDLSTLKSQIGGVRIGKSGYPYILDSQGNALMHPSLEGQNVSDSKDSEGRYFIREMLSNKRGFIVYPWKNSGETASRMKAVLYTYLPERDWIIGLGYYIDEVYAPVRQLSLVMIFIGLIIVALVIILGIWLAGTIANPVKRISENLTRASDNLESAANQVSSSSQELSSGSSELASSIEEMTSSLEELQSIIEGNTKNVNAAEALMRGTNESAMVSSQKMEEMSQSLTEITENSRRIVKIIKVIDDIAFQTNILALNAAVEAARAGDAGRGFAVVAEQVKTLAQKSATAAKETADLIDRAIESVARGESRGSEVVTSLFSVVDSAAKVGALLDETNRASREQLKGATQVTKAISQINSVVQGTAANSEQTAAAGEELLSQAEMLRGTVGGLNEMVTGKRETLKEKSLKLTDTHPQRKTVNPPVPLKQPLKPVNEGGVDVVRPEDKIPLGDFKDF